MLIHRVLGACGLTAAFCVALTSCGGDDFSNPVPLAGTSVKTLSTRADLVSGGNALGEVKLPAGASAAKLKVSVGMTDMTSAFVTRADGRTVGLVTGLADGANTLTATSTDNSFAGASLTITSHPIGGPVLLSSQPSPWICATPVPTAPTVTTPATNASGLTTAAIDVQCNIATERHLLYRTLTPVTSVPGDGGCSFVLPDPRRRSPTRCRRRQPIPACSRMLPARRRRPRWR